ncbi:DoxX family membrane protein [Actinomadura atramentaria]|uniref:DoxX family membrane protein n=1 Tax=Actinomadura atramentaria TaxID=1990 RepID=UPI0003A814E0|nr:DoxX family membrane protein [Actinomadura atramentaria]
MAVPTRRPETPRQRPAARDAAAARYVWAVARLALGWVFLWAFLDKTFGLGHATPRARAWIEGGSPTEGFLKHTPQGPLADFYHGLAGSAAADWLFMAGLAGIGAALLLGIGTRVAAAAGAVLLVMMWSAVLPPADNVFMDDHLVYAVVLVGLALTDAGDVLGLGGVWGRTALVRRLPFLK